MFLGNPSLPVLIDGKKAGELLKNAFAEKNWKEISVSAEKLILVPYFLFEYSTYREEERHGEKIVTGVERKQLVLNPETNDIVEDVAESLPSEREMLNEIADEIKLEVKKSGLDEERAEKICQLKTAELLEQPLNRIIIENVLKFYAPLWEMRVLIGEQQIMLHVSASSGNIVEKGKIPHREKSAEEIARETFNELKDPKAWLRYSKEIIELASKGEHTEALKIKNFVSGHLLWAVLLILTAALLFVIFLL